MKRTLLISAGLLSVLVGALWFACETPDQLLPTSVPAIEIVAERLATPEPLPLDITAAQRDAGPPLPSTVHLTLHVSRGTKTAVGERVAIAAGFFSTLTNTFHRTSSLVDSMGDASFDLVPGPWNITSPEGASPARIEVTPTSTCFDIQLPERFTIVGHVVGPDHQPVDGVEIKGCKAAPSDANGRFTCVVERNQVFLQAVTLLRMSETKTITLPTAEVTLELQDTVLLEVTTSRPWARVMLTHLSGMWICESPCKRRVPVGPIRASAFLADRKGVWVGHEEAMAKGDSTAIEVALHPAAPLSGVVKDESGTPLPGVTVRPLSVPWQALDASFAEAISVDGQTSLHEALREGRPPSRRDAAVEPRAVVITDTLGRFALPIAEAQPTVMVLEGAWRAKKAAFVTPDTASIELVGVPYQPP